jgi:hypothetical protein
MGVTTVVVPEAGLVPLDEAVTGGLTVESPFALPDGEGHVVGAVMADEGLAAHFGAGDPVLGAQQLLADLAVLYGDAPGAERGVVVRPPRDWTPSATLLDAVLDGLSASASPIRPVSLDDLVAGVPALQRGGRPVVRETLPTGPDNPLPPRSLDPAVGGQILEARRQLDAVRSLTGPTADLGGAERHLLLAEADGLDATTRQAHASAAARVETSVRTGVHLVPGRTFRLTAREGTIPLTLVNENPFPVTVTLDLASDKLEFLGVEGTDRSRQEFPDLVLDPEQHRVVKVLVRARASAAFPLRATLRSPSGQLDLGRVQFTVVSTAVPGVGIALSVGAGLVLVWWWVRHWRRTRARPEPDAGAVPGTEPEPEPEPEAR